VLQDNDGVKDNAGLNEKRGVTNDALWDSLKTTCMHMQRADLATLCDRKDLEGVCYLPLCYIQLLTSVIAFRLNFQMV
jgi:peroxin-5